MPDSAIAVFPFRIAPLNNIQPFTYRDGMSHLQLLEKLRVYINDNLRSEFNDELDRIITEFNDGMMVQELQFNTAFTDFVTAINDEVNAINNRVGPEGVQHETLTENFVIEIDPVWPDNQHLMFDVVQDATGGRTISLAGETIPVDPAPNSRTVFTIVPVSDGSWQVQENSYEYESLNLEVAGKLDTATAVADYLSKVDGAATYQTIDEADTVQAGNLTITAASALYPTKGAVIGGRFPERRGGNMEGATVAFLGDSYASGVGPTQQSLKWTSRYAAHANFTESNHAVSSAGYVNQGVSGSGKTANQAAAIPLNAVRVIVCAGINDTSFTVSQVAAGVAETIGAIRTRVPDAEIIIISPMWWNAQPSDQLREVERTIRNAVPGDVRYVEGAMWLRQGRPDMQTGDGHPNDLGSLLIARWVEAMVDNTGPGGALEGSFERVGLFEDELVTSSGSGVGVCGGTIYDARPGKWRFSFDLASYGTSDGFIWIGIGSERLPQRWGINTAGTYPETRAYVIETRHPGGDLVIEGGMTMNAPINLLSVGTRIKADWLSD